MLRSSRTAVLTGATLLAASTLVLAVGVGPASAKWVIHNSNDVTLITPPPGGTETQTCSDRLKGTTGWSVFTDQPATYVPPSTAFSGVNYEIWKPPPGFASMNDGNEQFAADGFTIIGYSFFDTNGIESFATKVKAFTTANRTALATPIPVNDGGPAGDVYVFTTAPIDEALSGVAVGEVVGVRPTGGSTFLDLTAVSCSSPTSYAFGGFYSPVNNPPTLNTGKAGLTYPVKFQLKDAAGAVVSSLSAVASVTYQKKSCAVFDCSRTDALEKSVSGGTSLTFNSTSNRFVYKWATPGPGCYLLLVTLDSGQVFKARFKLS